MVLYLVGIIEIESNSKSIVCYKTTIRTKKLSPLNPFNTKLLASYEPKISKKKTLFLLHLNSISVNSMR
jgi:hypothetical protein